MKKTDYENALKQGHYELLWHDLLSASGYSGCLPNGNIVDRRYFPEAIPVKENKLLGIARPRETEFDKEKRLDFLLEKQANCSHKYPKGSAPIKSCKICGKSK